MQALLGKADNDGLSEEAMFAIEKKINQELNNCAEEIKGIYQNSSNINSITAETIGHAIRQIPIAHFGETTHLWNRVINGQNPEMLASLAANLRQCLLNNADVKLCLLAFIHCVLRDESQTQFDEAIGIMLNLQELHRPKTRQKALLPEQLEEFGKSCREIIAPIDLVLKSETSDAPLLNAHSSNAYTPGWW